MPEVRAALVPRQRALAEGGGIIMAGRDIGTAILPDADLKLYLDASPEERARRRAEERGLDPTGPEAAAILDDLRRRDDTDSHRAVAPLRAAEDAHHIRPMATASRRRSRWWSTPCGRPKPERPARSRRAHAAAEHERTGPGRPRGHQPAHLGVRDRRSDGGARLHPTAARRPGEPAAERPVDPRPEYISNADPVVVGAWLTPALGRRIHWLAKKEIFAFTPVGWVLQEGGIHPVDRGAADVDAYRLALRVLEAGNVLLAFPEGTRSPDGQLQEAKDGLATLALRSGAPILPIGVSGTDQVWPRGKWPRPGGHAPSASGDRSAPPTSFRRALTAAPPRPPSPRRSRRIAALVEPRHRGRYADTTGDRATAATIDAR